MRRLAIQNPYALIREIEKLRKTVEEGQQLRHADELLTRSWFEPFCDFASSRVRQPLPSNPDRVESV